MGTGRGSAGAETSICRNQGNERAGWPKLRDPAIESGNVISALGMDGADDRHRRDPRYAFASPGAA